MSEDASINVKKIFPKELPEIFMAASYLLDPLMIWGQPGIGKTQMAMQAAKKLGARFVDVRLTMKSPEDVSGLQVPDLENMESTHLPPSWFPQDDNEHVLLFFDEIATAEENVQAAAYSIILERTLEGRKLGKNVFIAAASNRLEDAAVFNGMGTALADRFTHVQVIPDAESFLEYGAANDRKPLHPSVMAFIKNHPDKLAANPKDLSGDKMVVPSPRSWETISDYLYQVDGKYADGSSLDRGNTISEKARNIAIEGRIGEATAALFIQSLQEVAENITAQELFKMKDEAKIMAALPTSIGGAVNLIYALPHLISEEKDGHQVINILEIMSRHKSYKNFPDMMTFAFHHATTVIMERNGGWLASLCENKAYEAWHNKRSYQDDKFSSEAMIGDEAA